MANQTDITRKVLAYYRARPEGVGVSKDGMRVVRDEQGILWKLSERL